MALHNRKPNGCVECGKSEPDPRKHWFEMLGYARPKTARGGQSGSSLVLREQTGRYVCESCALDRLAGRSHEQESLI
jgi:hypothetical protein